MRCRWFARISKTTLARAICQTSRISTSRARAPRKRTRRFGPTDLTNTPQKVQPFLDHDQHRLYTMIYNRFVASQMTPAVVAVTNVEIQAGQGLFKAKGSIEKFDGYRKVWPPASRKT